MRNKMIALTAILALYAASLAAQDDYEKVLSAEIPADFKVVAVAGGIEPWTPLYKLEIDAKGNGVYSTMAPEERASGVFKKIDSFQLEEENLRLIFEAVRMNHFFTLEESYISKEILGGTFAELTVTDDQKTRKVRTQNMPVEAFDNIMTAINIAAPEDRKVMYNELLL